MWLSQQRRFDEKNSLLVVALEPIEPLVLSTPLFPNLVHGLARVSGLQREWLLPQPQLTQAMDCTVEANGRMIVKCEVDGIANFLPEDGDIL